MSTVHLVAGLEPKDGGPSYSIPRLCAALGEAGWAAPILTVGDPDRPAEAGLTRFPQSARSLPLFGTLRLSPDLRRAALEHAVRADIVHAHGLWLMPNVYAGRAAARANRPLIVSPRGMLAQEALAFSKHTKRLFWVLLQGPAYARSAAWHATSREEAAEIRAFGIKAPITIIPNGIDIPYEPAWHEEDKSRRTVLFLSRLHPKKNIPSLIEAWRRLACERPGWELLIVGPDEGGHRGELKAQIARDAVPHVRCLSSSYGTDKERLIANADLFVLPTRNENFGIAVAEALAAGVPAIVTRGAPWSKLGIEGCGWWIDHGVAPLEAALRSATALLPSERRVMGARGRAWMAREFAWDAIAAQMIGVYRWTRDGGPPPSSLFPG